MKERRNISDGDLIFPAIALSKECAKQADDLYKLKKLEEVGTLIDEGAILVISPENHNFFKNIYNKNNKNNKMVCKIYQLIIKAKLNKRFWENNNLPSFLDDSLQNLVIFDGLNSVLINIDKISKESHIFELYNSSDDSKIQLVSLDDSLVKIKLRFQHTFQKGDFLIQALENFEILIKWASSITIVDSYAIKNHKSIQDNPKSYKNMKSGLENFLDYISDVLVKENKILNRLRFLSWDGQNSKKTDSVKDWKMAFNEIIEGNGITNQIENYDIDGGSGYGIQLLFDSSHNHHRFIVFENNGLQLVYECGKGLESLDSKSKNGENTLTNDFTIRGPERRSEWRITKQTQIQKIITGQRGKRYSYPFNSKD